MRQKVALFQQYFVSTSLFRRRKAYGSAHLCLVAHSARACGFAVRVRLGNCIPHLRRGALRACSAGGTAVSLPSSGCNGAPRRPGNKEMQAIVHTAPVIYGVAGHSKEWQAHRAVIPRAAGAGRRSYIAAARRRKRVSTAKKQCKPDAPESLNIAAFLTALKENCQPS